MGCSALLEAPSHTAPSIFLHNHSPSLVMLCLTQKYMRTDYFKVFFFREFNKMYVQADKNNWILS